MYRWLVLALAMAVSGVAQAQWKDPIYVGGAAGPSKFSYDTGSIPIVNAASSTFSVDDDSDTAFKIFGGWRFNRYFAAEVGIVDFGTFSATRSVTGGTPGSAHSEISVAGVYVDAVAIAPVLDYFDFFAKVGAIATGVSAKRSTTGSVSIGGTSSSSDDTASGTGLHAAVGVNFRITSRVWGRMEYERAFGVGDKVLGEGDVSAFTIGASYRF